MIPVGRWVGREGAVIKARYHFWLLSVTADLERQIQGGFTGATGFRVLVLVAVEQKEAGVGNLFDEVLMGAGGTAGGWSVLAIQLIVEKYL